MTSHTPGPWSVTQPDQGYPRIVPESEPAKSYTWVVGIAPHNIGMSYAEVMANARMMAASPDLRAQLRQAEQILTFLEQVDLPREELIRKIALHLPDIRAALAKATEVPHGD